MCKSGVRRHSTFPENQHLRSQRHRAVTGARDKDWIMERLECYGNESGLYSVETRILSKGVYMSVFSKNYSESGSKVDKNWTPSVS